MRNLPPLPTGRSDEAGFTLIELLVVLAVIGLLITAVPLIITKARPGAELRAAASDIAHALRAARLHAMSTQQEVLVQFDAETDSYQLSQADEVHKLPDGIGIDVSDAGRISSQDQSVIHFYPDGSSTGGAVSLISHHQRHVISVLPLTGRVVIDD